MKDYTEIPFIDYLNAVDDYLEKHYDRPSEIEWTDDIAESQEQGESPKDCAEWFAKHYNLTPRN